MSANKLAAAKEVLRCTKELQEIDKTQSVFNQFSVSDLDVINEETREYRSLGTDMGRLLAWADREAYKSICNQEDYRF